MNKVQDYDNITKIPLNSKVTWKQYQLQMNEKKHLQYDISGILFAIITPEEALDAELIRTYYKGVDEKYFPQLSQSAFIRLVLQVENDQFGMPQYVTVSLNKYYMMVGVQTLEYEQYVSPQPSVPTDILGFNSYELGNKFKH